MSIFVEMIGSSIRAGSFDVFLVVASYVLHWFCNILYTNNVIHKTYLTKCLCFIHNNKIKITTEHLTN